MDLRQNFPCCNILARASPLELKATQHRRWKTRKPQYLVFTFKVFDVLSVYLKTGGRLEAIASRLEMVGGRRS